MRFFVYLILQLVGVSALCAQVQEVKSAPSAARFAIVVDCSGTQRLQLDKTISLIKQLAEAMRPGDEAFIVRFVGADKITITQDFTHEKAELQDAADDLYIEGGQTAIVDAIDFTAHHFAEDNANSDGSTRAIVLISDGDERKGSTKADATLSLLKQEKIKVFAIGISDLTVSTKLLDKFAKETGGKTFVPRTTSDLSNSILEILAAIRGEQAAKK
jgi:VWFA-related protein